MAYDLEAIKANVNLVDLASHDTQLTKAGTGNGGEYAGPCPKCSGDDRFHVQGRGLWMCRQCHPAWADVLAYVQWRDGVDFSTACETLGGQKDALKSVTAKQRRESARPSPVFSEAEPPSDVWQARAGAFVAYAQGQLWESPDTLAYLHGRGLSDETIRAAGLGYNPKELHDKQNRWELDNVEGKPKDVWLPVGWVIPAEMDGALWYVKIRRLGDVTPKYAQPRGGRPTLYGGDTLAGHSDAILTEGEFDALLLRQHVGDLCGVATLGSCTATPSAQAVVILGRVRRLWAAYDADKAGQDGAAKLGALSERIHSLAWPNDDCKDVTDLWRAKHDLVAWVVGNTGPGDPDARRKWCQYHLEQLWDKAGDETLPGGRLWQAILSAYEALGPDGV